MFAKLLRWLRGVFGKTERTNVPQPSPQEPTKTYTHTVAYEGSPAEPHYEIILQSGESGFLVQDTRVVGDRHVHLPRTDIQLDHLGQGDEFGHGIYIVNSSGKVSNVLVEDCWGDGIVVTSQHPRTADVLGRAHDVVLQHITSRNNRRCALSFIGAHHVLVEDSVFENTHGTSPHVGVDFEPDRGDTPNEFITLRRVTVRDNQNFGILCDDTDRPSSNTFNITIEDSEISASREGWALWLRFAGGENIVRNCDIFGPVTGMKNVVFDSCRFWHDGTYTQSPFAIDLYRPENVHFRNCRVNGALYRRGHPKVRISE